MKNNNKGRAFGRFDIKQKLKKDSYNQYRLYFFIATIISPFFSFLVFDEVSFLKNIYTDLTIPILFLVIVIWSFYNESIKKNLNYIFFIYCLFLSIYAYLIYAHSGYTVTNFLGFIIAFFAIMIGLNNHRLSLLYSVFCLIISVISHLIWREGKPPVDISTELTAFSIISIVGFVIHYNSHKSVKTILYNEGLLSNILNSTGDGMLLLDDTNTILDLNRKAKELFKIDVNKSLVGTELNGIFNPLEITNDKHEFIRSDKSTFICEVRKNKIEYQGWNYTIFILVDITELKKTSEALKENEEKFRLLFEATNDAIFILEGNQIVDCNDKSLESFGFSIENKSTVISKGLKLYETSPNFQPDGSPSFEKLNIKIKDVLEGNSQMFYWRFMRKDGVTFDAEVSLNSFQLNNKIFIQAIVRDITSRLKAEVALRESEDRFKMLSNATIEGIIFTEEGVIIDSNEQFALMYGFNKRNEVIGKNTNDFLFSESEIKKVKKIIDSSSEEKFEVKSKKKNGEVIWVESKGRIIPYHGRRLRVSVVYDITDRKLKEQQLQETRESFMNLTELSPNGSIIHINGIIQYANPVVLNFLGYSTVEEIIGKNITNLLPQEQQARSKERILQITKGENVGFAEFNVRDKEEKDIEIGVQSVRIKYNGKEAIHAILSNLSQQKELQKEKLRAQLAEETNTLLEKEIQERKETEQRLWETQMFTTNMFNSSLDMIMASDRNNLITQVNNAVLKIFGYNYQEIICLQPKDLYASEQDFEAVRLSLIEKGIFSGEIKNVRKNGETFISFLSASVLKNTQGKIIGTMGISRDITESLRSQQKIREQDAKIRSIFDNAANMLIWTIDTNYCLLSFNHNFTQVLKTYFDIEPTIGMSMAEIIRPLLSQDLYDYCIQSFEKTFNGKTSELEGPFKTKNNQTIWIETFLNPILMEGGEIKEISCISHEITEKKASESQIRQSLKEKEVLLKEVHHRVKNNLQVISSILNLQSSYVKDDQILSVLRESQNRIKSMSYIHESLYQTKNFSSINFSEYIVNLSNNLFHSYQIFDNFIDLKLKVDPVSLNLDQAIPCGLIVNELITNALKYAFKNKKAGEIFIGISEKGKTVSIQIEDNGVGLPKGFNYLKTETLGLQLVATLVEQLDGNLELKSDKGTNYLITFDKLN